MRTYLAFFAFALALSAQPPVAPTNDPTGPPDGENVSNYNIRQAFEAGYRFRSVGGDEGMYRSTVNYGDGIRLLSSSLSVQSRDGKGKYFDQIVLTTQGLGNDPYQFASLRVEKNRIYRYDLTWRSSDYYNPALTISYGEHLMDTVRHMQDQDFTLFPQGNYKLFLGYSRDTQTGPALSTIQLFDSRGDEYPLFEDVRREQNEYRLGGEVKVFGFRINAMHGWEDFKEDSERSLTTVSQGNNPNDLNQLNSFLGVEPYHGTSPYWRVALFREGEKYWAVNGRFTYVAGRRDFSFNEISAGLSRLGTPDQQQVVSLGNAQRPAATGNLTFSIFPASSVTVTNQTSIYNIRMEGDSYFVQFNNGIPITPVLPYQFLGIQTIANTTDVQYRVRPWLTIHGGYGYSDRRIRAIQTQSTAGQPPNPTPDPTEQNNSLNAGTFGIRVRPLKQLSINLDSELGHADKPIYPISDKDYHALKGRVEYKTRTWRVAAFAGSDYNTNSNSLTSYAAHTRRYGVDGSWTLKSGFFIDAGYERLHLDTLGGLAYFAGSPTSLVTGDSSYYVSNINSANLAARVAVSRRIDLSIGFNVVQDVGDGRATAISASTIYTSSPAFLAAQTFPLRYLSPQGKLSFKITEKIRWNAGYQYYGYSESFSSLQDYRAHTGYTSIAWSF